MAATAGPSIRQLYEEAFDLVARATTADEAGDLELAVVLYDECCRAFLAVRALEDADESVALVTGKVQEYLARAEQIQAELAARAEPSAPPALLSEQAAYSFEQAIQADEAQLFDEALKGYLKTAELLLAEVAELEQAGNAGVPALKKHAAEVLHRAEQIKARKRAPANQIVKVKHVAVTGGGGLTEAEKHVLSRTSIIHNKKFYPWVRGDLSERFYYSEPFTDPDGLLPLSPTQKGAFHSYQRPSSFVRGEAKMIVSVSPYSITQTVVTDCSFVASLAIASAYERRFKTPLITNCIFPQTSSGEPIVNPSGKYMIVLRFNGCKRKVIVDDYLPVDRTGRLLCSHSSHTSELWISLIEKAFLKLHGGYNFPGSNSGIDLHVLTGWIPEKLIIGDKSFNKERAWQRMKNGHKFGDALITIATGESATNGLVPSHAYAVLDVREALGKRFLLVKNPWANKGWKGNYSKEDRRNWTPALAKALSYDVDAARRVDDGVFWIDFVSACSHFSRIHLNWNPKLFQYRYTLHASLSKAAGPRNDKFNLGYNPQYRLEVNNSGSKPAQFWIVLSKHITNNTASEDFMTLHVYSKNNGGRVYYPGDALHNGTYSNSPHYVTYLSPKPGRTVYTLVASLYEKINTLYYSLAVYGMCQFKLVTIAKEFRYERRFAGTWTKATAGGSMNDNLFERNPQYRLTVDQETTMIFRLECPKEYAGNVVVLRNGDRVPAAYTKEIIATSGSYRNGFAYVQSSISPGVYTIVCSTFRPGQTGQYFLTIGSSACAIDLVQLP